MFNWQFVSEQNREYNFSLCNHFNGFTSQRQTGRKGAKGGQGGGGGGQGKRGGGGQEQAFSNKLHCAGNFLIALADGKRNANVQHFAMKALLKLAYQVNNVPSGAMSKDGGCLTLRTANARVESHD